MRGAPKLWHGQAFRFLVSGGLNTACTYLLYVLLTRWIHFQMAYLLAYLAGIVLSYFLAVLFVFKKPVSFGAFMRFPLVYLAQYVCSAVLLGFLIGGLGVPELLAPLVVVVITLPLTFVLSRHIVQKY